MENYGAMRGEQLKLLVVLLVLSNIGLGAFSFYLLREIDHTYSDLFDRSVPVLNDLQSLTAQAVGAMRNANAAQPTSGNVRRAAAGEAFTRIGEQVVAEFAADRVSEATRIRDEILRPAFERYLTATTKLSDVVEAASTRVNDAVSARASNFSRILLGIGSWPVILLGGLLLLTLVFVVVLMVLFLGREMSDMP